MEIFGDALLESIPLPAEKTTGKQIHATWKPSTKIRRPNVDARRRQSDAVLAIKRQRYCGACHINQVPMPK